MSIFFLRQILIILTSKGRPHCDIMGNEGLLLSYALVLNDDEVSVQEGLMDETTGNSRVSHLAWCALVALHIARREGITSTSLQENLFLTRWLATAEKQRLFPRELAADIAWMLKTGREMGTRADLPGKLEYLWRTGNGSLLDQKDLFRLQQALHALRRSGWFYMVLSDKEWSSSRSRKPFPETPGLYLNKNGLDNAFDAEGNQIHSLLVHITGDFDGLDVVLRQSGWRREPTGQEFLHSLFATSFDGSRLRNAAL